MKYPLIIVTSNASLADVVAELSEQPAGGQTADVCDCPMCVERRAAEATAAATQAPKEMRDRHNAKPADIRAV